MHGKNIDDFLDLLIFLIYIGNQSSGIFNMCMINLYPEIQLSIIFSYLYLVDELHFL